MTQEPIPPFETFAGSTEGLSAPEAFVRTLEQRLGDFVEQGVTTGPKGTVPLIELDQSLLAENPKLPHQITEQYMLRSGDAALGRVLQDFQRRDVLEDGDWAPVARVDGRIILRRMGYFFTLGRRALVVEEYTVPPGGQREQAHHYRLYLDDVH